MNNLEVTKIEQKQEATVSVEKKEKKLGKCPLRHSNFFITINTQKNLTTMSAEDAEALKAKFDSVMNDFYFNKLKEFVVLKGSESGVKYGLKKDAPKEELETRIEKAKCEFVIEEGSESHKLHSHGLLSFSKRACDTKLDYDKIRDFLREQLGFECHFKNIMYKDAAAELQAYIRKAPVV